MKNLTLLIVAMLFLAISTNVSAQDQPISPTLVGIGQYHGLSQPLRDLPALTADEWEKMEIDANKPRNEELRERLYPFESTALPKGDDPA